MAEEKEYTTRNIHMSYSWEVIDGEPGGLTETNIYDGHPLREQLLRVMDAYTELMDEAQRQGITSVGKLEIKLDQK